MLKIKSIFVSLLAVAALASCSNENDDITDGGEKRDYDVAYMSVSVAVPQGTRTRAAGSSGETDALDSETKIKELYLVLFDDQKKVVKADGATAYYTILGESQLSQVDNAPVSPLEPIKVSTESAYLLTIANPGAKLKALLNGIVAGNGYADINKEFSLDIYYKLHNKRIDCGNYKLRFASLEEYFRISHRFIFPFRTESNQRIIKCIIYMAHMVQEKVGYLII